MMNFETILKTFDYSIADGSAYQWKCYPAARFMVLESDSAEVTIIYSTVDQTIYEAEVDAKDSSLSVPYRWLNPQWKDAYYTEAAERNIDPVVAYDDVKWTDLEVEDDFLTKARFMFDGKFDFDKRIQIDVELPADLLLHLAMQAHELDITLNQYLEQILRQAIENTNA
jgi:hypothetical protein